MEREKSRRYVKSMGKFHVEMIFFEFRYEKEPTAPISICPMQTRQVAS